MTKRVVAGVLLAVTVVLLVACEVEEEVEGPEPTLAAQTPAAATAQATSTALPTPTLTAALAELERLRQEEAAKPKFEGVINGIRLYPTDTKGDAQRTWACTDAKAEEVQNVDISAVVGTPLEIVPTYLPAGAEEGTPGYPPAVCKGTIAYVERKWGIPGKGYFYIIRYEGEHAIDIDVPADRLSATTIGGKPAVLVKPLVEVYDGSTVIVAEDFGITVVGAIGISLDETVKIAEGLK